MPYPNRRELIRQIAKHRRSHVITYITGDRENVSTRIAPDALPVLMRHLRAVGATERIDLFLYTRGGDVLTPWRLVHLLREFAPFFGVLVPYRAYSAGTLICLGADEIVMATMGELGPIDPSVVNAFNPEDPHNTKARIPVNVEDVYSYLALAREKAGLTKEKHMAGVFQQLAEMIHPLALGNVHRNYLLVRSMATRLLGLRQEPPAPERVGHIVNSLTEKLYAHNHMIPRREAEEDIGLTVVRADVGLDKLMWALLDDYRNELALDYPFNPADLLEGRRSEFQVPGGFIESQNRQDIFLFRGVVERRDYIEGGQVNADILYQGWCPGWNGGDKG